MIKQDDSVVKCLHHNCVCRFIEVDVDKFKELDVESCDLEMRRSGGQCSLLIKHVTEATFSQYKCELSNSVGTISATGSIHDICKHSTILLHSLTSLIESHI